MKKINIASGLKVISYFALAISCFYISFALAGGEANTGIGKMASNLADTIKSFGRLLTAVSFLSGLGFATTSVLQFKAYKDNPGQTPLSKPIISMFVAVGLLFLPTLFKQAGETLFGGNQAKTGSLSGFSNLNGDSI